MSQSRAAGSQTANDTSRPFNGEPLFRWFFSLIAVGVPLAVLLSYAVCVRLSQGPAPQPDGSLHWHERTIHSGAFAESAYRSISASPPAPLPSIEWCGFGNTPTQINAPLFQRRTTSGTPIVVLIPIAIAATLWVSWFRRRAKSRAGLCRACGYDLAGISPGLPCPECGNPAAPANG